MCDLVWGKGDDNYFLGPVVCTVVNTIRYAATVSAARTHFRLQFTLLRDFFPKLFLRLSVSLLNFLMILLAYSYSLPQFLWLTGAPASYCLVTPLLESFMRTELCLHQILDIDLEQDTLMFPKTLLELSVSILKYFVNRWNLCKLVYFSAQWCLKFINMYVF